MLIEVTQDDIDRGCKSRMDNCPVARAFTRALTAAGLAFDRVSTYIRMIAIRGHTDVVDLPTPGHVIDWMDAFDHGESVQPFSFTLEGI